MASGDWDAIISWIKQQVGRDANKIARGVAAMALQDLQEAHSDIISDFYAGYTPVTSYHYWAINRKGQLFRGMDHGYRRTGNIRNSILPQGITGVGTHGFAASIFVGAMNMDGYINSTGAVFPAEKVFDYIWNYGNRGLPPGYRGHVGEFTISTAPVGIGISGTPHEAMSQFVNSYGPRAGEIADMIAYSL